MVNDYFVPLNLPDPYAELDIGDIFNVYQLAGPHPFFDARNFTIPKSLIEKFKELELTISLTKTFLFKLEPLAAGPIHLDGNPAIGKLRPYGFNWAWGSPNTSMEWFDSTSTATRRNYQGIDIPYFDKDNTTLLHTEILISPNLVNLLKPHRVINHNDNIRLCLSIGIEEKYSWDDIVKLLCNKGITR